MDDGIEKWAHRYVESALHPACTCAMGKCADKHLRVKGVQGLRVCDASAFATQSVDGNPVATLFAMAEKLGEELLNEYSGPIMREMNFKSKKYHSCCMLTLMIAK